MTDVLIKRGHLNIETGTWGECHVKMKAEMGVRQVRAKKYHRLPASHWKQGEKHGRLSFRAFQKDSTVPTP